MERPAKRTKIEAGQGHGGQQPKKNGKRSSQKTSSKYNFTSSASGIHSDDVGIFFTCDKGQERKCMTEFHDVLSQYIETDESSTAKDPSPQEDDAEVDIEADIEAELDSLKPSKADNREIKMVTLDIPCVSFARLSKGLDPVSLVHRICQDAADHPDQKRSRYIKRLTPISLVRKTLGGGLEQLCEIVLKPYFHSGGPSKKFAIRPTIRNNNQLDRDTVIKTVATAVGQSHSVDLTKYDLLILVDIYRNVCGMSVVGNNYEKLKRYNLAEIYQPSPKPDPKTKQAGGGPAVAAHPASAPDGEDKGREAVTS